MKKNTLIQSLAIKALVISLGLTMVGCVSNPTQQNAAPAPTLIKVSQPLMIPNDSAQFYYAMGEGETTEAAKNAALSDISARISVSVESSIDTTLTVQKRGSEETIDRDFQKNIKAKAKNIEFSGVRVLDTQQQAGQWQVVVEVDKYRLFESYQSKLASDKANLNNVMAMFKSSSEFEKLKQTPGVQKVLISANANVSVLQTLKPSFNAVAEIKSFADVDNQLLNAKRDLIVHITFDKASKGLASLVKDRLTEQNIRVTEGKGNVSLEIKTTGKPQIVESTNPRLASMKVAQRQTSFIVKDKQGRIVSNAVIKTKGVSYDSYDDAMIQTKAYEKEISDRGIISVVTGNE